MRPMGRMCLLISICAIGLTPVFADPVDTLRQGGSASFHIMDGDYFLNGATGPLSGNLGGQNPVVLNFAELGSGTGLDFRLRIRDVINAIDSDYLVTFRARVLANNIVEWSFDETPNVCVNVTIEGVTFTFSFEHIWGIITTQVSETDCQTDPLNLLTRKTTVRLDPVGGDPANNLNFTGHLACVPQPPFEEEGHVTQMQLEGYGGGLAKARGNLNGDCCIDDTDLARVMVNHNTTDAGSDVNGDGVVNDDDARIVLSNYGCE